MERAAFRTKRKIFATLGADRRVSLVVQPAEQRDALLVEFPGTFFSPGGWTRLGYLAVDVDDEVQATGPAGHVTLPAMSLGRGGAARSGFSRAPARSASSLLAGTRPPPREHAPHR